MLGPGRLDQLIYIPLPDDGSRMAILKWVSSLFLSSKQGEDLWCHFQSCAYPGLTFANHLWQTMLIFPIWPRFESFLFRTVFFILLSTCRWLAGSLVPTWLKSANVLASSLSGQWACSGSFKALPVTNSASIYLAHERITGRVLMQTLREKRRNRRR